MLAQQRRRVPQLQVRRVRPFERGVRGVQRSARDAGGSGCLAASWAASSIAGEETSSPSMRVNAASAAPNRAFRMASGVVAPHTDGSPCVPVRERS